MPLTIAAVLNFIPQSIWKPLKKFIINDGTILFDIPFKFSTKYTPALLIIIMCLSFANQFIRNVVISCSAEVIHTSSIGSIDNYGGSYSSGRDSSLNEFCWKHGTFLVEKSLDPKMRGELTYPGVSRYKRTDVLIRQRYYKYVWLSLGTLAVFSFLPLLLWKLQRIEMIKSLVNVKPIGNVSEDARRVSLYLKTVGFNDGFGNYYLVCKFLAGISPILQWLYICGFIGPLYMFYGINVVLTFMNVNDPWPNPMDAVFPKMAKCEWFTYGFSGRMEVKTAQCQLPLNNLSQWSFFLYWWWLTLVLAINIVSCLRYLFNLCRCYREFQYRKFVEKASQEDIEVARTYSIYSKDKILTLKKSKYSVVHVNLSFGNWLVLDIVKKNLEDSKFRDFIQRLVLTKNIVLQLKPAETIVHPNDSTDAKSYKNANTNGGVRLSNTEISFRTSVLSDQVPSTVPNELLSSPLDSMLESSKQPMEGLPQLDSIESNEIERNSRRGLPNQILNI